MNEKSREALSALLDDEASELEIRRLLSESEMEPGSGAGLRDTWARYSAVKQVLQGHELAYRELDVSVQVREALHDEAGGKKSVRERFYRPLASLAVAASVAATVVIGGQQLVQVGAGGVDAGEPAFVSVATPVGVLESAGAVPVMASYGTRPVPVLSPLTRTAYDDLARRRQDMYMQLHAEQSALNSPQGLLPFARVTRITE